MKMDAIPFESLVEIYKATAELIGPESESCQCFLKALRRRVDDAVREADPNKLRTPKSDKP